MNTLVEQLLRMAVSRWPASLRDVRAREWAAEMHQLGRWGRLRFVCSLALSPSVNADGVPMGWREVLPAFGRGLQPLVVLFGCGLMCWLVATLGIGLGSMGITQLVQGNPQPAVAFNWPANGLSVVTIAIAAGALFWAGKRVGARMNVAWVRRGWLTRTGSAIVAPAFVGGAAVLVSWLQQTRLTGQPGGRTHEADSVTALIVWAICFTVIAAVAMRVRRSRLIAVMGTLVTLDLTAIVAAWPWAQGTGINMGSAPLWLPVTLLDLNNSGVRFEAAGQGFVDAELVVGAAIGPVRTCLLASAFVLGYALAARAVRAVPARPAPVSASTLIQTAAAARSAVRGWLIAGSGLSVWVYALTTLTAALNPHNDGGGEHHLWVHEIRQAAILVTVTGLALAIAGRGAIIFPSVLAFAVLWGIDALFDSHNATSVQAATLAASLGVIVLYTARQLAHAIPTNQTAARRALAGFAVLAAFCAPAMAADAILYPRNNNSAAYLPDGYSHASAIAVGLLSFCALLCAQAVRNRTHWIDSAMIAILIGSSFTLLPAAPIILGLGTPLAALTAWYMRPPGSTSRWALILPSALVAGIPVGYLQLTAAAILGVPLMTLAGYPPPHHAQPILPAAILIGTTIAATAMISHTPTTRTVSEPLPENTR